MGEWPPNRFVMMLALNKCVFSPEARRARGRRGWWVWAALLPPCGCAWAVGWPGAKPAGQPAPSDAPGAEWAPWYVEVVSAPEVSGCVQTVGLVEALRTRLPAHQILPARDGRAPADIFVRIGASQDPQAGGAVADIEVRHADGARGRRRVDAAGRTCQALSEQIVVALAVLIQFQALVSPSPAAVPLTAATPEPRPETAEAPAKWWVFAGPAVRHRLLPGASWGADVGLLRQGAGGRQPGPGCSPWVTRGAWATLGRLGRLGACRPTPALGPGRFRWRLPIVHGLYVRRTVRWGAPRPFGCAVVRALRCRQCPSATASPRPIVWPARKSGARALAWTSMSLSGPLRPLRWLAPCV